MNKLGLITTAWNEHEKREAYYDSLPEDIRDAFIDNEYLNSMEVVARAALRCALGYVLHDWLDYAMYEANGRAIVDDKIYEVSTLEGFINFIKMEYPDELQ